MKTNKLSGKIVALIVAVAVFVLCGAGIYTPVAAVKAEESVKTADVYMIAGQSNAAGSTSVNSTPYGYEVTYRPKENVLYYGGTHKTILGYDGRYFNDFRPVRHGCGFNDKNVGFELGMANVLNEKEEYKGANKKAIIFKSAAGGTSVMPDGNYGNFGNWYPESLWNEDYWKKENYYDKIGFQYRVFLDELKRFFVDAKKQGFEKINLKGLFWMQGETDRGRADDYVSVCSTLFEDFRTSISKIANEDYSRLPIYVGEISETFGSADVGSVKLNDNMIAAQHKIANSMPAVYVARLRDYAINKMEFGKNVVVGSDQSHWNYEDIVSIGKDFMRLFYDVDGKLVYSASVRLDGSDSAKKRASVSFAGEYGPNYDANTEKLVFSVKTSKYYTVESVSALSGKVKLADTVFEGDELAPTLKYELTGMQGDDEISVALASNKKITVNVSGEGEDYGSVPSQKTIEDAYIGCRYEIETFPFSDGALYKFEINGKTVYGKKNVVKYVFDDWEKYLTEEKKTLDIKVFYGEKNEVNKALDNLPGESDEKPGTSEEKGDRNCTWSGSPRALLSVLCSLGIALIVLRKRRGW